MILPATAEQPLYQVDRTDFHVEPCINITPELATEWLRSNTRNRNQKNEAIARYAADMTAGNWALNGEAIKFSVSGVLLDGQNRLRACLEAGVTFPCMVVFGLADLAQDSMDGGKIRTMSDILGISHGVKNPNGVATTVSGTLAWVNGLRNGAAGNRRSSRAENIAWFVANRDEMIDTTKAGGRIAESSIGLSSREASILWWVLSKIDVEEATDFFDKFSNGIGLEEGHPILHLRKRLQMNAAAPIGKRMPPFHKTALVSKAWNMYRDGERPKTLTYSPGGKKNEAFPEPR